MSDDHLFVDSLGGVVRGREAMRAAWQGYFAFSPDYWVKRELILADDRNVAAFGVAGGTIAVDGRLAVEHRWQTPAAWLAVVEAGVVKEWRVYADNKPVYDILSKSSPAARAD
jgi:ketosteroid isomerase-like protein